MNSSNPLLLALVVLQIATLSFLMLLFFNPPSQTPIHTVTVREGEPAARHIVTAAEWTPLVREMVRAEVAAATSGTEAVGETALSEHELQMQAHAATASAAIIEQATAAGVWTRADTEALLPHIGRVSDAQRMALMDEFYSAINRQELKMNDFPPL